MAKEKLARRVPLGDVPVLDVAGTAFECGEMMGWAWASALKHGATCVPSGSKPWWATRAKPYRQLISKYVPHLPDIYRGMARGSGVPEELIGTRRPVEAACGCTSYALQPSATLDGIPISGQTKDTGTSRALLFVVLRMRLKDGPSALTLTYPGWLFGHGFVQGGCSIFRNSLFAGDGTGELPYTVWGLVALHCPTVDDVVAVTRQYGVRQGFHSTVADEHGGVVGIELGRGGMAFCKPKHGIYVHANAVTSGKRSLLKYEDSNRWAPGNSILREARMRARLEPDHGRLTAQLAYAATTDHEGFPASVCRHQGKGQTTASVVVEPTRGALHVCRGNPCQNWPRTYAL